VTLAVLLLHHAHRPLPEIDWRTLGGLQERIRVEQLSRRRTLLRVLHQAFRNNILEDMRERVTLRQPGGRLEYDLLQQVEDMLKGNLPIASSISVRPTLQTSLLTVYGLP
jgi:hypothetical protein